MITVTRLARQFGLSRTALLHYDRIGLLSPSARSATGARLYDDGDVKRLESICRYRKVGLPLDRIRALLDGNSTRASEILESRLTQLSAEIDGLRDQQRVIVSLLSGKTVRRRARLDKTKWVAILRASGLDDDAMHRWHIEFERMAPESHREFLSSLGLAAREIGRIRRWSRLRV